MIGKYESMIILAPNLSNEDIEKENKKILDLISELGGEFIKTDTWGKKQLAYEIMKFREGFYLINYFNLDTQKINEIDRHYRLNEKIIRHNVIKLDAEE
ncbi:MAG: 30S ribosomal protein S6 [Candidatus Cloacimonetes bacterium]|jgi:small subunit ribosomal protein S6|nr:30S ribosomal protein S6 [Candidatus Cloacimonadota bacterium]MDD4154962.1 30S ribosomal protein S6 [Candidatus Cloacimonadota bacterium]